MIKATHVFKKFGSIDVLKDISLEVKKGELVSITGPSGAGKTSLLHILGTLSKHTENPNTELIINDKNILTLSEKELARFRNLDLGFIFQFHQLLPEFTALENVCIPAYIAQFSKSKSEKRGLELLDFLGLADRAQHKPAMLSGGEQQRVAVARSLINTPALILADEPSGNLDSHSAKQLHQLFVDLRDNFNQTIVLVTHNEELAALTDRKLHLVDGKWL